MLTLWEMGSALVVTSCFFALRPADFVAPWVLPVRDVGLLLVLAIGCTVVPWLWSLRVLQTLKPYALALAVSLETVYGMALAYLLFPHEEALTWRFYLGTAVLLGLVLYNTWRRR